MKLVRLKKGQKSFKYESWKSFFFFLHFNDCLKLTTALT